MTQSESIRNRLDRYEEYVRADPANPLLLGDAFDLALAAGELDDAERYIGQALAQWPDDMYFLNRSAQLHAARKNWAAAESVLGELCARYPDHAGLSISLASIYYHTERYEETRAMLERLLAQGELVAEGYPLLLRSLHRLNDLPAAVKIIDSHRESVAGQTETIGVAALIFLDAGDFANAASWSELALQHDPSSSEGLVTAGMVALARQDIGTAEALLSRALRVRPQEGRVWSSLGLVSLLRQDFDQARQQLERATVLMPDHIGTWHVLGWVYIFRGDAAAGERIFRHALAMDRNFGESHGGLAVTLAIQSKREEAEEEVQIAQRLDPRSLSAHYASALLRGDIADRERFTVLARRVLSATEAPGGGDLASWIGRGPLY